MNGTLLGLLIVVGLICRQIKRQQDGPPIGLALSGGGYRSALFGLGALFYLVDSKKVERLDTIASVSGGSYTNAKAFLYNGDLSRIETEDLVDHFKGFVRQMTRVSPLAGWGYVVLGIGLIGLGIWEYANPFFPWFLALGPVILLALAVPLWGRITARWIWIRLFGRNTRKVPLTTKQEPLDFAEVNRRGREKDTPWEREFTKEKARTLTPTENTVHHVICTAEINYKEFLYFTNRFVAHRRFGRGSAADYTVKRAVDASAALPPVFAPLPVRTKPFRWAPQDTPSRVLCVDGGVHDTLATEWFRRDEWNEIEIRRIGDDRLWQGGTVIVVNGSAPNRVKRRLKGQIGRFRLPLVWWWTAHRRTLQLAFSNWDRRNYGQLNRSAMDRLAADQRFGPNEETTFTGISIEENPYHEAYGTELTPDQRSQLSATPVDWRSLVRTSESVSAIPRQLSQEQVVNLLYHGYVLTWRVMEGPQHPDEHDYRLRSIDEVEKMWFGEGGRL